MCKIVKKTDGYYHDKCGNKMEIKQNMFALRSMWFSGLVCEHCNALFDNPDDSFLKFAGADQAYWAYHE